MVKKSRKRQRAMEELSYDYDDLGDSPEFSELAYGSWARSYEERRDNIRAHIQQLAQNGEMLYPVTANGRKIAKSFWGQSWCRNLEAHHDYESRLPRGRTYLRKGSVLDLKISCGTILARVSGSHLYDVEIRLQKLADERWKRLVARCSGSVGSVLDLLGGQFSAEVMTIMTDDEDGLFPAPDEISMSCTCLDWAHMCKHIAAVLYGVGARLDENPELFFLLRGVDHTDLVQKTSEQLSNQMEALDQEFNKQELETLFGIDLDL